MNPLPQPPPQEAPVMLSLRAHEPPAPLTGHLAMGSPHGPSGSLTVDSRRVLRAGRPWIPVMGEFHFSRYPAAEWREELLKMRAGGIDLVATYLFWNQHEEQRGGYRFDGGLDIRRFAGLCAELDLALAVRIGPWAHGECRNGGFPDWLAGTGCVPRTDDPGYLALVAPYYARIGHELRGRWHRDGGPVIAVQVENELYDQPGHLATLRRLAEEAGLDAPLWTATAWGSARLPPDVLLPLYGGYPEAFWEDAHPGWARGMRRHYFFTPIRDDHAIGADLRDAAPAGSGPDDRRYPYATCELGGGMAIAYHRRPLVPERDVTALALTKLGSGSVWQGYYLYHGGSQRQDTGVPNQESHATGYPNDLPSVSYDFQAPLGEYGQVRPSFHALRQQHLLLRDSGAALADMPLSLPDTEPDGLDDRTTLRWAVRARGDQGFLFVNNHQPHEPLPDHEGVRFTVRLDGGCLTLPEEPVTVPSAACFVWPLGYELGPGVRLVWATAQPLTRLDIDGTPTAVLAATEGVTPRLLLPAGTPVEAPGGTTVRVRETADGTLVTVPDPGAGAGTSVTVHGPRGPVLVLLLSAARARHLGRVRIWGHDRLVLCPDLVVADGDELRVHTPAAAPDLALLPAPPELTGSATGPGVQDGAFTRWTLRPLPPPPPPAVTCVRAEAVAAPARTGGAHGRASAPLDADFERASVHHLAIPPGVFEPSGNAGEQAGEVLLRVRYTGDVARAYIGGRLVADHFWYGPDWEIGLRRFAAEVVRHGIELRILPLARQSLVHVDPSARAGLDAARAGTSVDAVSLVPLRRLALRAEAPAGAGRG